MARREEELRKLREQLDAEEQTLLILRLDRKLSWKDIALILSAESNAPVDPAALRKRFERLKRRLQELAQEQGLLDR